MRKKARHHSGSAWKGALPLFFCGILLRHSANAVL